MQDIEKIIREAQSIKVTDSQIEALVRKIPSEAPTPGNNSPKVL